MKYLLYQIRFTSPVRFGVEQRGADLTKASFVCRADTFFSALCNEAVALDGQVGINKLVDAVKKEELLFTDLLPFCEEGKEEVAFYIPRPMLEAEGKDIIINEQTLKEAKDSNKQRKKAKKAMFLRVKELKDYLAWLKNGTSWEAKEISFGEFAMQQKVNCRGVEPKPYFVNTFSFQKNSGLYFIAKVNNEEIEKYLYDLINSLSYTGLGGKRYSGYGRFEIDDDPWDIKDGIYNDDKELYQYFEGDGKQYMALTSFLPSKEEINKIDQWIEQAKYRCICRSGFIESNSYSDNAQKKNSVHLFVAGSCFGQGFKGDIIDVAKENPKHPVFRYAKPLFARFDI